jgi:hypothetical protein
MNVRDYPTLHINTKVTYMNVYRNGAFIAVPHFTDKMLHS